MPFTQVDQYPQVRKNCIKLWKIYVLTRCLKYYMRNYGKFVKSMLSQISINLFNILFIFSIFSWYLVVIFFDILGGHWGVILFIIISKSI